MTPWRKWFIGIAVGLLSITCSSDGQSPAEQATERPTTAVASPPAWVNKAWRVVAPQGRAPGSLYVFLSNGTLLMTSCVETYRLATWRAVTPGRVEVREDAAVRYEG